MPCHTRMKTVFMQGVLWLSLLNFGLVLCVIEPGYLDFDNLPDTNFSCVGKVIGGYYADLETSCQMFHVCTIGQLDEPMDIRFLCLNGTVFDQETRVCERVDEVDCTKSERFYHLNLELYGNTAPPIVEESGNTEPPVISSTTSTTTPRSTSTSRNTRGTFFTTSVPTIPPPTHSTPKVITSNQFPINGGPDIRFNPEEINIRLTPGSPPIIKSPSVSFQQQNFNGDARITVTTHSTVYKDDRTSQKSITSTQKPKSVVSYGLQHTSNKNYQQQPTYDYSYQQTENSDVDYHTDLPSSEYTDLGYDTNMSFEQKKQQIFSASTTKRIENKPFVSSTAFSSAKPPQVKYQRTDKPPNVQLPVPLFPTLSPLQFSSPAPFTLTRHIEQKRSNDHQRPRIIVSASASVSDASGRKLNYNLGTIGSQILGKAPHSYDKYEEGDVPLDPFYHDVPKVANKSRRKRDVEEEDNTAKEETSNEEVVPTTRWTPPDYVDDNYEPLTYNYTEKNTTTDVVEEIKKSSTENSTKIIENSTKTPENNTNKIENNTKTTEREYEYYYEYVDDNYEPAVYEIVNQTIDTVLPTTESNTDPSFVTQETTIESNTNTESMKEYQRDTTEAPMTTTIDDTETTEIFEEKEKKTTIEPTETTTETLEMTTETLEMTTETLETTTENKETTTVKEPKSDQQIGSESKENIKTITTAEATTISSESLREFTITTPLSVTESANHITTTTENSVDITTNEETTTIITVPESTTDLHLETTTELNSYTTNLPETTLNQDRETTTYQTTTHLNTEETTTNPPTTIEETSRETTTDVPSTTPTTTTTTTRYSYLRTREPSYKRYSRTKPTSRHRFSSPSIHMSPSLLKLRGNKLSNPTTTTTFTSSEEIASEIISHRLNKIVPESQLLSTTSTIGTTVNISNEDVQITDAPLSKSANPTEPKNTNKSPLSTTPITKTFFIPRRFTYDIMKSFNCFGKQMNKFYEDPRDCRLFHYCTPGYSETQVLDMKFVCDYGTYFDSDKLICTKMKPQRCT